MANPDPKNNQNNKPSKLPILLLVIAALLLTVFGNRIMNWFLYGDQKEVTYDEFLSAVAEDRIEEIKIGEEQILYTLRDDEKEIEYYTSRIPGSDISDVTNMLRRNEVSIQGV